MAQLLISIDISASQRVLQVGQLSQAQQQQQAIHISQLVQSLTSMQLRLQTQRVRQAQKYFTVKVSATATLKNASTISATSIKKGSSIKLTAKATGGTAPYKYRYFCKPEGASGWTALTRTTTATSYTHKPARAISYQYAVKVADSTGKTVTKYFTVNVK